MNYFKFARFFAYLIPFGVVIVSRATAFPFIVGKYAYFRTLSAIVLILFLLGLLLDKKADVYLERLKSIFKNPLVKAVSIFVLAFIVSGFFGLDPANSFWSNFERGEGGLQMLHFFAFFISLATIFNKENHWKNMFWSFVGSAYLMILYGVGAGLGLDGFIGAEFGGSGFRFSGSIGNPAYVAIYLIFSMFFTGHLLHKEESSKESSSNFNAKSTLLYISLGVFLVFFLLAATRGAFLGLGAGIFVSLIYLAISQKSWRKPVLSTLLVLILLFSIGVYFNDDPVVNAIPGSRIFDISIGEKTFQDRTIMWGIALEGFKDYSVFGVGPENYFDIFISDYDPVYYTPGEGYGAWFDRAHSIIFDYLAMTGIVGFLSYLSIFIVLFWQITKTRLREVKESVRDGWSKTEKALVLGLPVAYLVQGLVLFDVSTTYISLFMFLAFIVYKFDYFNKKETNHA